MSFIFTLIFCLSAQGTQLPSPWNKNPEIFEKLDKEQITIGEILFSDPILSKNKTLSCSSCHDPKFGFSNGKQKATGVSGIVSEYNVPVIFNKIDSTIQFWDGRVGSLKEQIFHPILDKNEMGMTESEVLERLNNSKKYRRIFKGTVTRQKIEQALVHYISSLVSGDSRFDKYVDGDKSALTEEEIAGKNLFFEKYRCDRCHSGNNFSNGQMSQRCGSLPTTSQIYSANYKVPTLRNLAASAPYLHNGRLETLEDVMDFYDQPIFVGKNARINEEEKKKIILFLKTLNSDIRSYKKE